MTEDDLDKLADKIHAVLAKERREFWVDPEQHYRDHQSLHDMVQEWKAIKTMFWKTFFGMAIIGALAIAGLGSLTKMFKG